MDVYFIYSALHCVIILFFFLCIFLLYQWICYVQVIVINECESIQKWPLELKKKSDTIFIYVEQETSSSLNKASL